MRDREAKENYREKAELRLRLIRGRFRYEDSQGSRLDRMPDEEKAEERALIYAEEALMDMPELRVTSAEIEGESRIILLDTPSGELRVEL